MKSFFCNQICLFVKAKQIPFAGCCNSLEGIEESMEELIRTEPEREESDERRESSVSLRGEKRQSAERREGRRGETCGFFQTAELALYRFESHLLIVCYRNRNRNISSEEMVKNLYSLRNKIDQF